MEQSFCVIGGDRRQSELARLLVHRGCGVVTYGLAAPDLPQAPDLQTAAQGGEVVVLPLLKGGGEIDCGGERVSTKTLFSYLTPRQTVLAGQLGQRRYEEGAGLTLRDYFSREELTVANAAITAECALRAAMERMDETLHGMDCLVLGFGRVGKLLAHRLAALGARVCVAARGPEALAWARAYGYAAVGLERMDLSPFGVVFNTVPSLLLDAARVDELSQRCLCVELASSPGIDLGAARRRGLPCVEAGGLPGRLAPRSAAKALLGTIDHILAEERGDRL